MYKYFKGEIYKLICSKFIYITLIIIFIYSLFANYLYLNAPEMEIYSNFISEYLLLFLALSLFYASTLFTDEYYFGTINDLKNNKLLLSKLLMIVVYLLFLLTVAFFFTFDIAFFLQRVPSLSLSLFQNLIIDYIKILPMLIIINLSCLLISLVFLKSNLALGFSYGLYILCGYIGNLIISKGYEKLYFLPFFHWNFNSLLLERFKIWESLLICFLTIGIAIFLIFILFNKRK